MTLKTTKLRDAISFALAVGVTTLAGTGVAFAQDTTAPSTDTETKSNTLDRIEVTGSRIDSARIADGLRADMLSSAVAPVFNSFTQTAFVQNQFGYASAASIVLFFICIVVTVGQFFIDKRRSA